MDDANVAFRLKGFIDSQGLSHSQFSDKCGIPRPSLSQILSGRNKKVSDVIVGQIHKAFPELSILWLLFGEGEMIDNSLAAGASTAAPLREADSQVRYGGSGSLFDDDDLELSADGSLVASRNRSNQDMRPNSGFDNREFATSNPGAAAHSNVRALNAQSDALKEAEKQIVEYEKKLSELQLQIEKLHGNPRKVSHITVYYDDSTFETFVPQRTS